MHPQKRVRLPRGGVIAACLLLTAIALPAAAQQRLSLTTTHDQLTMTNVVKSGRVIVAGMTVQSENGMRRLRRFAEVLTDTDGDGQIEYAPEGKVPQRSAWAAVDLTNGSVATAGGPGLTEYLSPMPETAFKKDLNGLVDAFATGTSWLDLVLVRPGEGGGAWRVHAYDGEAGDADAALDGKVKLFFDSGEPLLVSFKSAPKHVKKDDVVVLIDLRHLRLAFTSIAR
jgi:hypothetical protein